MARPASNVLTPGERRIMDVLWDKGEATVRDVELACAQTDPIAYTTAQTMLQILVRKGYAAFRKEGRAHVYAPAVSRSDARTKALRDLLGGFFAGSPEALAQHLLKETELDLSALERLEAELDAEDAARGNPNTEETGAEGAGADDTSKDDKGAER